MVLNEDRLFPADPGTRLIARRLYEATKALAIVSPHGHCDPAGLVDNAWSGDPAYELVTRDHYLLRLLYSHGVPMESLGVQPRDGARLDVEGRQVWQEFAQHYHLFRGTPSKLWLDHTLADVLGIGEPLRRRDRRRRVRRAVRSLRA